jgi:long-chain acyl-CoA synthetase
LISTWLRSNRGQCRRKEEFMNKKKPWLKFYGEVPETIQYPDVTLYQALMGTVERYPDSVAYDFFGTTSTYRDLGNQIDQCARALSSLGLEKGNRITISMPTCPQGIICVYAAAKLGAVASMIHPLSPPKEIEFYLNVSKSSFALTLDAFYPAFRQVQNQTGLKKLVLTRISDYLRFPKNLGFWLAKGRKIPKVPVDPSVVWYHDLIRGSYPEIPAADISPDSLAVIMYSGGTTGKPKGIKLSHRNFIAEGMQVAAWGGIGAGDSMLAILPIFHGFGLGVCINAVFMGGAKSILVPQFSPEIVAKLIKSKRPTHVVGVPTLYEALASNPVFLGSDLSCLKGAFVGADHMPRAVKERFEEIVRKSGKEIKLLEGYGLTEAVTAIMCMPLSEYREGSIGIPFPDMEAKVVETGTVNQAINGQEGELCIHGPAVMLGYLDQPEETAATLKEHSDGKLWLHTGDIASRDDDGFFYFKSRLKRMIKSSGMNVYPAQVEDILCKHSAVDQACVIGVPDRKQVERVKGFVVLKDAYQVGSAMEKELIAHCREHLIKWSCPREIEFRTDLPKTLIGKIDFKVLLEEELSRIEKAGESSKQ